MCKLLGLFPIMHNKANNVDCMKEEYIEDVSALITSALSLAVGLGYDISADTATLFGSITPVVQRTISRVLTVFQGKSFAKIESARMGVCYNSLVESIKKNEADGKPYNDAFFSQGSVYGKIDELAEAVLRAAMDDSQIVKSHHYGKLLGNALYQTKYDESSIFLLLRIAQKLSFDELCLLAVLNDMPQKNYEVLVNGDDKRAELMVMMANLKASGILRRMPPFSVGATLDNLQISVLGKDLYTLMDLQELDPNAISDLKQLIDFYVRA